MREELVRQLLAIVQGYRAGQIARIDENHIERWLNNFEEGVQLDILRELTYTLNRTYFSYERVQREMARVLAIGAVGGDFWRATSLLEIQQGGNSQRDMNALVSELLHAQYGIRPGINEVARNYIYLDDGLYTGKRAETDLCEWILGAAPNGVTLYVVAIYMHTYGRWALGNALNAAIRTSGKNISLNWRCGYQIEDRKLYMYSSDVLRPTHAPADINVQEYVGQMRYPPIYRVAGSAGGAGFFSSCDGRGILEQELLKAGAYIKAVCRNLNVRQRPLGNSALDTLGFGSMMVTYRNCPNNAPLALWVDAPWYPLFPRMTNAQALAARLW